MENSSHKVSKLLPRVLCNKKWSCDLLLAMSYWEDAVGRHDWESCPLLPYPLDKRTDHCNMKCPHFFFFALFVSFLNAFPGVRTQCLSLWQSLCNSGATIWKEPGSLRLSLGSCNHPGLHTFRLYLNKYSLLYFKASIAQPIFSVMTFIGHDNICTACGEHGGDCRHLRWIALGALAALHLLHHPEDQGDKYLGSSFCGSPVGLTIQVR